MAEWHFGGGPEGLPPEVQRQREEARFETTLQLVAAAQKGDEKSLNDLFERYLPRTRRIVALRMGWRLKQLDEYEDLVQNALLKVFQGLDRFEAKSEGSFRNWVASYAECAIRDAARHAGRKKRGGGDIRRLSELGSPELSTMIFAGDDPTASQIFSASELEGRIEECLPNSPTATASLSCCGASVICRTRTS